MTTDKPSRPDPDPTILTTQQLDKSIQNVREVLEARILCMEEHLENHKGQLDDRHKAIAVEVGHLKELTDEKFKGIVNQFIERDTRTDKTDDLNQKAIGTAFLAAKEAVGEQNKSSAMAIAKSEVSMTKQLDQIITLITSTNKGSDDKIDDIKKRLTIIESLAQGKKDGWGYIVGAVSFVIMIVTLIMMILKFKLV